MFILCLEVPLIEFITDLTNQPKLFHLGNGVDVDAHNLAYLRALIALL